MQLVQRTITNGDISSTTLIIEDIENTHEGDPRCTCVLSYEFYQLSIFQ